MSCHHFARENVRLWPTAAPIRPPSMGPLTGYDRPHMRAPKRWSARPSLCRFSDAGMTAYPHGVAAGVRKAPRH
jgi:hypothetical protein